MTICLFTSKLSDGSGDVVQTVKVADFIRKLTQTTQTSDVIIVVPDIDETLNDHKAIVQKFVREINPLIPVKFLSEFKESKPQIECCIEAGCPSILFQWKKDIAELITPETPIIYMPEYGFSAWDSTEYGADVFNPNMSFTIRGGFDKSTSDYGVIPNQLLVDSQDEKTPATEKIAHAFHQLPPTIKSYMGENVEHYLEKYRVSHDFTFQYSHDETVYPQMDRKRENRNATEFFLSEHFILTKQSTRSQDVLCIGKKASRKKKALLKLKDDLVQNGYSKISFINLDTNENELIYQASDNSSGKEYRMFYTKNVSFSTMLTLPLLAENLIGVTGNNSLVEAMSAQKLVSYEWRMHERRFITGYVKAVSQHTTDPKVILLAEFLMQKESCLYEDREYSMSDMTQLLEDERVVSTLKKINKELIVESQYFQQLETILNTHVFKQEVNLQQSEVKTGAMLDSYQPQIQDTYNPAFFSQAKTSLPDEAKPTKKKIPPTPM